MSYQLLLIGFEISLWCGQLVCGGPIEMSSPLLYVKLILITVESNYI